MDQLPQRLELWWAGLDDAARRRASVLMLICVGYMVHYLVYCILQPFFIEDSAITYAFARHLVEGDGLAGYAGGERVEGYSNPTWTALMAAVHALGVPMWVGAKLAGGVLGVLTLPLVYRTTRRAMPHLPAGYALLGPAMLAGSVQFVLWNASGLENSLLCFLLAAAMHRLLSEMEARGAGERPRPWSGLIFALLAMTRPEGMAYAVFGGVALGLDALRTRRLRHLLPWALAFLVPFAAYQVWRTSYFAWPLPNTYYAKLGRGTTFQPFGWDVKGWKYVNGWFTRHGVVYLTPLLIVGLTGMRSWARWLGVAVLGWLSVVVLWDGAVDWGALGLDAMADSWRPVKSHWVELRVGSIAASAALLGLLSLATDGWRARGLMWISAAFGIFFAVYAGGDWMAQHRWFNIVVLNLLPLMAVGLAELLHAALPADAVAPLGAWRLPLRPALAVVLLAGWVGGEAHQDFLFANSPETSPRDIHRRVTYMAHAQRRVDADNITLLDVDMGAHMYFTGWDIVDIAGLIDVPMAQHSDFNRRFIEEYVFGQRVPDFAHVHGGWARSSKIPTHGDWRRNYIEIPGYPIGGDRLHVGNHVRKGLFVHEASPEGLPPGATTFGRRLELVSVAVRAPLVAQGGALMVESVWHSLHHKSDIRVLWFLVDADGTVVHSEASAPAWDWYPVRQWRVDEWVDGRHELHLPADLPMGDYTLGMVVLDDSIGGVLPDSATVSGRHVYLPGERITDIVVEVRTAEEAAAAAAADVARALAAAEAGDCDAVWPAWKDGRRHRLLDGDWMEATDFTVRDALAGCLVEAAAAAEHLDDEIALLAEARRWQRHNAQLVPRARLRAAELADQAELAFAEGDWGRAQARAEEALSLDPMRAGLRRLAEDARDYKLRIVRPGREKSDLPPLAGAEEADEDGVVREARRLDDPNRDPNADPNEDEGGEGPDDT